MAAPLYRLVQRFLRVEAVGMRGAEHGDLADPLAIEVILTPADDLTTELAKESTTSPVRQRLKRLRCGVWAYDLAPAGLQIGKAYSLRWRFQMTPENTNVVRSNFVWNPLPEVPSSPSDVVIYGTLADAAGAPVAGARLVLEEFRDYATLSHRLGAIDVISDAFGNWSVELPKGALRRFVFNELSKIIRVPREVSRAALNELPAFQPKDIVRVDRYGYPVPGQDLYSLLASKLTERETLAVLQSASVVRYVNESGDSTTINEGAEIFIHNQDAPSTIWVIAHGKDCHPVISVLDANMDLMYPDISYPDRNTVVLSFNRAVKGKVVLICGTEKDLATPA